MLEYFESDQGDDIYIKYEGVMYAVQSNSAGNPYVTHKGGLNAKWEEEHRASKMTLLVMHGLSEDTITKQAEEIIKAIMVYESRLAWFIV